MRPVFLFVLSTLLFLLTLPFYLASSSARQKSNLGFLKVKENERIRLVNGGENDIDNLLVLRGGFRKHWQKKKFESDKNSTSGGWGDGGNGAVGTGLSNQNSGTTGAASTSSNIAGAGSNAYYNSTAGLGSSSSYSQQQNVGMVKGFWLSTRFMERFFRRFLSLFFLDPDILRIVSKICATIFWAYLALSALGTIGFDTKPLLSLLSISGLTFGFAAKDILTNLFAGIFIIFTRPFKRGQIISVNNIRGKVMSIDVRYCKLQSLKDKSEMLVPLSVVYSNAITIENPTHKDNKDK